MLPLVALVHVAFFRYTSPATGRSLSVCVCAKCGSSSVYHALHYAILARKKRPGPPSIHAFLAWRARGVSESSEPGEVHVHVTRDPIDRYLSAFHNKLRCCPGTRVRCCPERVIATSCGHGLIRGLLRLARNGSDVPCLHLDDFARALHAVHRAGRAHELDEHFLPQPLACPLHAPSAGVGVERGGAPRLAAAARSGGARGHTLVLRGNVSTLTPALAELDGFAFRGGAPAVRTVRRTRRGAAGGGFALTPRALRMLCELSRAEYRALDMSAPAACA